MMVSSVIPSLREEGAEEGSTYRHRDTEESSQLQPALVVRLWLSLRYI